jgi:hypothetical protein
MIYLCASPQWEDYSISLSFFVLSFVFEKDTAVRMEPDNRMIPEKNRPFPDIPTLEDFHEYRSPEVMALLRHEAALEEIYGDKSKQKKQPPKKKKKKPARKKKNPQPKVKDIFPAKENEDGYPMKHCQYEPLEGRLVYRPSKYGSNFEEKNRIARATVCHCTSCHLKPCICDEFFEEAADTWAKTVITEDKPFSVGSQAVTEFLNKKYCKVFKRRYSKKHKPPDCITRHVLAWYTNRYQEESSVSDESLDDEDEDIPLSVLRDRQIGDPPAALTVTTTAPVLPSMSPSCRYKFLYGSDSDDSMGNLQPIVWRKSAPNRVSIESSDVLSTRTSSNKEAASRSIQKRSASQMALDDTDSENEF